MPAIRGEIDQLWALQTGFDQEAENLARLMSNIDRLLSTTAWVGTWSDQFKTSWIDECKHALTNVQETFTEASAQVARLGEVVAKASD